MVTVDPYPPGASEYFDTISYSIRVDGKDTSDFFYYSELAGNDVSIDANVTLYRLEEDNPQIAPLKRSVTVRLECEAELFDGTRVTKKSSSDMLSLEQNQEGEISLGMFYKIPYGVQAIIVTLDLT